MLSTQTQSFNCNTNMVIPNNEGNHLALDQDDTQSFIGKSFSQSWLPAVAPPIKAIKPAPMPEWFKPRKIQWAMLEGLANAYRQDSKSPLIMAMTGSGKTLFAGLIFWRMLTRNPKQRLLFMVPRVTLIDQTVAEFERLGLKPSVIWQKDPRFNPSAQIHVASKDTLWRRVLSDNAETSEFFSKFKFDVIVVDEAHRRDSHLNDIPHDYRIGLSASPFTKGLGKDYDKLIKTASPEELVSDGVIKPLVCMGAVRKIDESLLKVARTGEYTDESETLAANELIGDVVNDLKTDEHMKNRTWIGFCRSIATCEALYEDMIKAGLNVTIVHSKISQKENERRLEDFNQGLYDGVVSINKLAEGFDNKKVNLVLLLTSLAPHKKDPTRPNDLNKYIQSIGRGRRANEGDVDCLVKDYGNNWIRYGSPDRFLDSIEELDDGKTTTKKKENADSKPKPKECPNCHVMFTNGHICPDCQYEIEDGTQYIDGEKVKFLKGKMVNLTNRKPSVRMPSEYTQEEKKAFLAGLKFEAVRFGKAQQLKGKPWDPRKEYGRWINQYKNFFGKYPPNDRSFKDVLPCPHKLASAFVAKENKDWIQQQRRRNYGKKRAKA